MVSPAFSVCTEMSWVESVMVGCSCQCAESCSGKSGALPYSRMPGRTQSPRVWSAWRRVAALLAMERSPGRSRVTRSKVSNWWPMPARAVGVAEVGHERNLVDLRERVETGPGGAEALGREAQAVHARVHLQEHALRLQGLVGGEHVDLLVAMHGVPEVQPRAQLQVSGVENAFQQQHRAAPAEGAHALGLGQIEQREAVGAAQSFIDPLDAMAIGICLDDGPDAGFEGRAARPVEVVTQGVGVDSGEYGTRHGWFRERLGDNADHVLASSGMRSNTVGTPDSASHPRAITAHSPATRHFFTTASRPSGQPAHR